MIICFEDLRARVIYSHRRSVAIQLTGDEIIVRAPRGLEEEKIVGFLREKSGWIRKNLKEIEEKKKTREEYPSFTQKEIQELADKALVVIPPKVRKYAEKIGVTYGRITIRNQRTRWGSCSSKGNLNFNCLLMLFPEEVIDYIVVHELCHRKQMNHSPAFYREVEAVFPEYKKWEKWLKEHGEEAMKRMVR